uniref:Skp1_POZ domain-containing protein n=1 Tax=Syphacia muris TaxID=451379 RepID=A0A0N5AKN2_9BILA
MADDEVLMLQSKDGRIVAVQRSIVSISEAIVHALEGTNRAAMTPIPLYQVDYETLKKIVSWMTWYSKSDDDQKRTLSDTEEKSHDGKSTCIQQWERNQFEALERSELFALMNAASYLEISPLSQSSAAFVAEKLQSMSVSGRGTTIFEFKGRF